MISYLTKRRESS